MGRLDELSMSFLPFVCINVRRQTLIQHCNFTYFCLFRSIVAAFTSGRESISSIVDR